MKKVLIDRRVALLRGINVGTAKRIAMADLRTLCEDLGYEDVRTLLNSGNIVFTVTKQRSEDEAHRIEAAIVRRLGVATRVTLLTAGELATAVNDNPFAAIADNPSRLLIVVPMDSKATRRLKPLLKEHWKPEVLSLGRRVGYLWCANGIAGSKLWAAANRVLGDAGTARNFATMTKLLALVEGSRPC